MPPGDDPTPSGSPKPNEDPVPAELRALYDIRVKEAHHYNTVIWAFPIAYATLLAAEIRFLDAGSLPLLVAAIFNFALCYVFWRHLQNKESILTALKTIESKVGKLYGSDYIPKFEDPKIKATTVMNWTLWSVAVLFAVRAFCTLCPCCR